MYGDQFGEFVCEYWDLKGLVSQSHFATKSNGESWDFILRKITSASPEPLSPRQFKKQRVAGSLCNH